MTNIEFIDYENSKFSIVKEIRTAVFTNEQGAIAKDEFDDYDKKALFALLYYKDKPVATARTVLTSTGYKIGRIAVLKECRGMGFGADIVKAVMQKSFELGAKEIFVDAQNYAVPFYEKLGFKVVGEQIIDRGLPHIPMKTNGEGNYAK